MNLRAISSLFNIELGFDEDQTTKSIEYVLQDYNKFIYGYDYNNETETFILLPDLYEQKDIPEPSEKEFQFGVERIAQFSEYLGKMNKSTFSVGDYRRYIGRMLKKKVRVQPMIRYLSNLGVITFVDDKTIHLHLEQDLNIKKTK
jgi:hypothetical protein